jgi:hypothetical protein
MPPALSYATFFSLLSGMMVTQAQAFVIDIENLRYLLR